jgi:predicted PilT family ATPase
VTHVPSSVLPHLVGSGGRNLKALMSRTLTKITIPRKDSERSEEQEVEEEVVISGDFSGVELARKEIEDIVAQRVSDCFL